MKPIVLAPYERGWLASCREEPKINPFVPGTTEHADYEKGFDDESRQRIDALKFGQYRSLDESP